MTYSLPILIYMAFAFAASGVLVSLCGRIVRHNTLPKYQSAALGCSLIWVIFSSLILSLLKTDFSFAKIAIELALLFVVAILYGKVQVRTTQRPLKQIYNTFILKILAFGAGCALIWALVCSIGAAVFYGLIVMAGFDSDEALAFGLLSGVGGLFLALLALANIYYQKALKNCAGDKTETTPPETLPETPLRQVIWPFALAILLLMIPMMVERYINSERFLALQNPPQRLQRV
ncbi:MAG: hypothetical protein ACK4VI_08960 [Alphaproteobacteria bacterium]